MRAGAGSIDELVAPFGPAVASLVEGARRLVKRCAPTAEERVRPGWGLIGYSAPRYFCFILPTREGLRLGFEWGVHLADPGGLLQGRGRQVRHVEVTSPRALADPALEALLRGAAAGAALKSPRRATGAAARSTPPRSGRRRRR